MKNPKVLKTRLTQSLLVSHNIKPTLEQTFMSPLCDGNIVKQMMVETSCSILSGSVFEECKKFVSIGSCVSHSSILYDLCWHWLQLREKVWLCWEHMGLGGGWLVFSSLTLSCSWCFMGRMHLYGMHYGKMHLWSNEVTSAQGKFYCTAQRLHMEWSLRVEIWRKGELSQCNTIQAVLYPSCCTRGMETKPKNVKWPQTAVSVATLRTWPNLSLCWHQQKDLHWSMWPLDPARGAAKPSEG